MIPARARSRSSPLQGRRVKYWIPAAHGRCVRPAGRGWHLGPPACSSQVLPGLLCPAARPHLLPEVACSWEASAGRLDIGRTIASRGCTFTLTPLGGRTGPVKLIGGIVARIKENTPMSYKLARAIALSVLVGKRWRIFGEGPPGRLLLPGGRSHRTPEEAFGMVDCQRALRVSPSHSGNGQLGPAYRFATVVSANLAPMVARALTASPRVERPVSGSVPACWRAVRMPRASA